MRIDTNFPASAAFRRNEWETLETIHNYGLIDSPLDPLATGIYECYQTYYGANFDVTPINLLVDFHMEVEQSIRRVLIGMNLEGEGKINSYMLALCDREDDKQLIRKFHFDFAPPEIPTEQRVPVFHLQYGGKPGSVIKEKKIGDEAIHNYLSVPRFQYVPMNLAILLDFVLCEFPSEEVTKMRENARWRSLVYKNECLLFKNYYSNIHNHLNSARYSSNNLLRDYCYGS